MDKFSKNSSLAEEWRKKTDEKPSNFKVKRKKMGRITTVFTDIFEGRKKGKYITIYFPFPFSIEEKNIIVNEIKEALSYLIPQKLKRLVISGIGNKDICADSFGIKTAEKTVCATKQDSVLKETFVIKADTQAKTGIKTAEYLKAIVKAVNAQGLIVIDSLASMSPKRLFKTLQITDAGITPASAVNMAKKRISEKSIGVPVISIGTPSVVDIGMPITSVNAEFCIETLSQTLAQAINEFSFGL